MCELLSNTLFIKKTHLTYIRRKRGYIFAFYSINKQELRVILVILSKDMLFIKNHI